MPTSAAPKPDSRTGNPRPPEAPLLSDWREPDDEELNVVKPWMTPRDNKKQILESYALSRATKVWTAAIGVLFTFSIMFLFWWGYGWMKVWWLWLIVISPIPIFLFQGKSGSTAAGADWLICAHGIVNTYHLTRVKITNGTNTYFLGLTDEEGNEVDPQLWHVQRNPKLWDLVYNGILYSVANGAECNDKTRKFLHIYT